MIAHKNLRSFLVTPALIAVLVFPANAVAAPKLVTVKSVMKWAETSGAELFTVTNKSVITVKNVATTSSNIEIQARDFTGTILWEKSIDSGSDEVATAITSDSQGNLWIAGNSAAQASSDTATTTVNALNPDNVAIENTAPIRQDMRQLTIWKLNEAGDVSDNFVFTQTEISLVEAISVSPTGISVIGSRESGPVLISISPKGVFGKELKIGTAKTKINSVVRLGDGSVNLFGSSGETLQGKKLAGREDGVLIKVSKAGAISSVVRSSAPKALRSWTSATNSLFLTGLVKSGTSTESAITKFSSAFAPTWTTRIASTGVQLAANGPNKSFYVALEPTAAIKGIAPVKLAKGQNVILQFDSKGLLIAAFTSPELSQVKFLSYSPIGGLFMDSANGIFRVGATK